MQDNNKVGRSDFNYYKKIEKINEILFFFEFSIHSTPVNPDQVKPDKPDFSKFLSAHGWL